MKPRVVIIDDHTLMADACRTLLGPACDVVGTFSEPTAVPREAEDARPDVVILDCHMPSMNGLDTARALRRWCRTYGSSCLTMNEDPERGGGGVSRRRLGLRAEAVAGLGAAAGGSRGDGAALLHHAAHDPAIWSDRSPAIPQSRGKPMHQLTPRQREVLQLLAEGHSMKEAAAVLTSRRGRSHSTSTA